MKRLILAIVFITFSTVVFAEDAPKKPSHNKFENNRFWDNWEISAGAGAGYALYNGSKQGNFGYKLGFEGNFSIAKWLHPANGVRMQLQGGRLGSYDAASGNVKWPYIFAHADFMVNLSNIIGGYRDDRAYYLVPFVGFGYVASNFTDKFQSTHNVGTSQNFGFTFGFLNKFRLSPSVDFNIELKSLVTKADMAPTAIDGCTLFAVSATAGFTYRFNKPDGKRKIAAAGYSADQIKVYQDEANAANQKLEKLLNDNARLQRELADAKAAADNSDVKAVDNTTQRIYCAGTSVVFFNCNKTDLTDNEKVRLDLLVDQIKNSPKDKVYTIEGHADPQTGNHNDNERLATGRAKMVYDYLVAQGVKPEQLKYEGLGDSSNPFKVPETNRVAVIK